MTIRHNRKRKRATFRKRHNISKRWLEGTTIEMQGQRLFLAVNKGSGAGAQRAHIRNVHMQQRHQGK